MALLLYMTLLFMWSSILITISTSFESTIRLYESFSEIQQDYNESIRFLQTDWNNIKHESIVLRSLTDKNIDDSTKFERRIIRIDKNNTGD